MTLDNEKPSKTVPILVRRSEPMNQPARQRLRYDTFRQVTQVELNGRWIDAPDFPGDAGASTRLTRVQAETTDDE